MEGFNEGRRSGPELLRIFAMLLIVFHHFAVHSGFGFAYDSVSFNRLWVQFLEMGGKIGVDLFVLISGYFLVSTKGARLSKLLQLWLQVFFYSLLLFIIFSIAGKVDFSGSTLWAACTPVLHDTWWFFSTYFVLYLLSPFLNRLARSLGRTSYHVLLGILLVLWCVAPTFWQVSTQYSALAWFVTLYLLAGYLRLHLNTDRIRGGICLAMGGAGMVLHLLFVLIRDWYVHAHPSSTLFPTLYYDMQMLPTVLISVLFFLGFLQLRIRQNRVVNLIASAMFGVYLIHDHPLVRTFLWRDLFACASFQEKAVLSPYSLGICILVFTVCCGIELLRKYGLERFYLGPIRKLASSLESRFPWLANPAGIPDP